MLTLTEAQTLDAADFMEKSDELQAITTEIAGYGGNPMQNLEEIEDERLRAALAKYRQAFGLIEDAAGEMYGLLDEAFLNKE